MCGLAGCYQQRSSTGPEMAHGEYGARRIWQLLTMEPRYRNARSMGVAA
jgi:hypothetical protein